MKAVILLTTNPGHEAKAYSRLDELTKETPAKGVKNVSFMHCWGRFDGVATCECTDSHALSGVAEALRKEGVFHTETLIAIE